MHAVPARPRWWWVSFAIMALLLFASSVRPDGAGTAQTVLAPAEQAALDALNAERTTRGLTPLRISPNLQAAAEWMAADLAARDLVDHTDSLGRSFSERFAAFGYEHPGTVRENLAAGQPTGADVMDAWMNSPGHRANNLSEESRVAGIALVVDPDTTYRYFWALAFGSFDDSGSDAEEPPLAAPPAAVLGVVPSQPGFALLVAGEDATGPSLIAGLRALGCPAISVWVVIGGRMTGYVSGAPAVVNARFPASVAAGAPFIGVCR